jgi:toxin ParE1/3/4
MSFQVVLTEDAERDLDDLITYIAQTDSPRNADHVLGRILEIADSITVEPTRGSTPNELRGLGACLAADNPKRPAVYDRFPALENELR